MQIYPEREFYEMQSFQDDDDDDNDDDDDDVGDDGGGGGGEDDSGSGVVVVVLCGVKAAVSASEAVVWCKKPLIRQLPCPSSQILAIRKDQYCPRQVDRSGPFPVMRLELLLNSAIMVGLVEAKYYGMGYIALVPRG
ncbi:hypothetical protein ElyMa_006511000 [Elysia marginata]|uniref:Uncharacterized protein n=1 Tax=Elysia marginata TaxID=1093978 RepID=A0AAV4I509_9GAST|nr:hypothetical protein ElyMa_006511000 [Elysia marginata]